MNEVLHPIQLKRVTAAEETVNGQTMRLRRIAVAFLTPFLALERGFLEFGDRLHELNRNAVALGEDATAAGACLSSSGTEELLSALASVVGGIAGLRHGDQDLSARLDTIVFTTDRVRAPLIALSDVLSRVQILAVNAKIESAHVSGTGIDFTLFSGEIARLGRSGRQAIEDVGAELASLRHAAVAAKSAQLAFEQTGQRELQTLTAHLDSSITALKQQRQQAAEGVEEILPLLASLSAHIGKVVSGLQIFDITRQRFEHVGQALDLAAATIETGALKDGDDQTMRIFVNGMAELQSAQLRQASNDYDRRIDDIGLNMVALAKGVPVIALISDQSFGGRDGSSMAGVERELRTAGTLFDQFSESREQARRGGLQVAAATARAADLIRSLNLINADMRLMGLNAAIKCGNMGEPGRVLKVVANELQGYAGHTGDLVERVAEGLTLISTLAQDIERTLADDGAGRQTGTAALNTALTLAGQRLHEVGSNLTERLDHIETEATALVDQGQAAAAGFNAQVRCGPLVAASLEQLANLAAETAPGLAGEALAAARREVLVLVESRYTMASERTVHGDAVQNGAFAITGSGYADPDDDTPEAPAVSGEPDIAALLF